MRVKRAALLAGLLLFTVFSPAARGSFLNADIQEEASDYRAVQKLIGFHLVNDAIVGQRPWPRSEVARMIREAEANLPSVTGLEVRIEAQKTLKRLRKHYAAELAGEAPVRWRPFEKMEWDFLFLDSPDRAVPLRAGTTDEIAATINPLTAYWKGREYKDNFNFGFEARHFLDLGRVASVVGNSQFLFRHETENPQGSAMKWDFDELYLRSEIRNIGLQIGRDVLAWGPAREGGVFHSTNATPMDFFKISNVHPFHYPWIFRALGPSQITAYAAVLGTGRAHDYPYVAGWKFSFLPHRNFEIGATHVVMSGGVGSRSTSLGNRIADAFGIFAAMVNQDPNISNRLGGFDLTWRLPFLRDSEVYYEVLMEDTQSLSHFKTMFLDEAIHQAGLFFPRLNRRGTHQLRLEFQRSAFRPYRHHQYRSGWTHNGRILGSELGPDAEGALIEYTHEPTPHFLQRHRLAVEERDSDLYAFTGDATGVIRTADNNAERRYRWSSELEWQYAKTRRWRLMFGYERVEKFNFIAGQDRNNFLVLLGMSLYPPFNARRTSPIKSP